MHPVVCVDTLVPAFRFMVKAPLTTRYGLWQVSYLPNRFLAVVSIGIVPGTVGLCHIRS